MENNITSFLNPKLLGNLSVCSALSVIFVEVSKHAIPLNPRILLLLASISISIAKFLIEEKFSKESIGTLVLNTISIMIGANGMYELGLKQLISTICTS